MAGIRLPDRLVEQDGDITATERVAVLYDPPTGDIFMEVDRPHRRGFGCYLVRDEAGGYPTKTPLSNRAHGKSPAFCSVAREPIFVALQRAAGIRPIW